ncbi:MAG: hypothetical protein AAF431_17700 [Pseudomonadota bacterium]
MDQTDIWMLGVGAFGLVFYFFALYYQKNGERVQDQKDDSE